MSYILEALRKSEQERLRGAVPNLLTVHTSHEAYTQPRSWRYGSIAAALIGVGVLIGWLHPWQQELLHAAPEHGAAMVPGPSPRTVLPVMPPSVPEVSLRPVQKPVPKLVVTAKPAPMPEASAPKPERHPPAKESTPMPTATPPASPTAHVLATAPVPVLEKAVLPTPVKAPDTPAKAPPPEGLKVLQLAELPTAIQQEIPPLSIPVHTYSTDPRQRIVGINGRLMQEGDYLAPDLKLEQITADGVIFTYKSYRFRYALP